MSLHTKKPQSHVVKQYTVIQAFGKRKQNKNSCYLSVAVIQHINQRQHEEENLVGIRSQKTDRTGNGLFILKPTPSDILFPARLPYINLYKQHTNSPTAMKHSNTCDCRGHFSYKLLEKVKRISTSRKEYTCNSGEELSQIQNDPQYQ